MGREWSSKGQNVFLAIDPKERKTEGFPGDSVLKNLPANAGDADLIPGRKITWRRNWQPTPVFLPGKSHGQRKMVMGSQKVLKKSDMT